MAHGLPLCRSMNCNKMQMSERRKFKSASTERQAFVDTRFAISYNDWVYYQRYKVIWDKSRANGYSLQIIAAWLMNICW